MSAYSQVMAYTATLGFLASFLVMGVLTPWYRSWTGRVLFMVKLTTFLVLLLVSLRLAFGDYPYIETVRGFIYTAASLSGWGVAFVILRAQLLGRRNRLKNMMEKHLWIKDESPDEPSSVPQPWDGVERGKTHAPTDSDVSSDPADSNR